MSHDTLWFEATFAQFGRVSLVKQVETNQTSKLMRQRTVVAMTLMDAAFHQLSLCLRSLLRFDPLCRVCQPCLVIRITGERLSLSLSIFK